ncbi:hypothetical protein ES707_22573 [subsurface metagenome]
MAVAAEGAYRRLIGIDAVGISLYISYIVGAGGVETRGINNIQGVAAISA